MGYDIFHFITRSKAEKYLCAVCQGVAKDVFETDCGHIFCRGCVGKLIRVNSNTDSNAQCPHCRSPVSWSNVHGSKFLNREISHLQCKCIQCDGEWIGNLSSLNEHQLNECPDQIVDCVWKKYGCKDHKIKRKDLAKHNEEYAVKHMELKLNCLSNQHQTQIASLKRKYEQQIQTLNQEKIALEKKWKQKLISFAKKYGIAQQQNSTNNNNNAMNNSNININHIENITITPTQNENLQNTQHHSDGSLTFDPNSPSRAFDQSNKLSSNRSGSSLRRKRKRSVLNEFGSDSNSNGNGTDNVNVSVSVSTSTTKKRVKKKRRMLNDANRNVNGSMLNMLLTESGSGSRSVRSSKSKTSSNRKRKGNKAQTPKNSNNKRGRPKKSVHNVVADNLDDDEDYVESSDSDGNFN